MNYLELIVWLLLHNRKVCVCNNLQLVENTYNMDKYNMTQVCK